MSKGIYGYYDKENNYILVYCGKDSHIDENRRHKDHFKPSDYNKQRINRVLQNNPDRYEYRVIYECPDLTDDELNYLECKEIMKHKFLYDERPKFNFTIGGEGTSGFTHSEETKHKIGEANKGWNHSDESKKHLGKVKTKNYARILKRGFNSQGKQQYGIRFNGKNLKRSFSIDKLVEWFNSNYPDEELVIDESIKPQ